MGANNGRRAERDGVRRVLTELRAVIDGRALPDSDRKFVSIFDIVDRKVWLAVGGVFRDATALPSPGLEAPVLVSVAMPAVGNAESAE